MVACSPFLQSRLRVGSPVAHQFRCPQIAIVNAQQLDFTKDPPANASRRKTVHVMQLGVKATPAVFAHRTTIIQDSIHHYGNDLWPAIGDEGYVLPCTCLEGSGMKAWIAIP